MTSHLIDCWKGGAGVDVGRGVVLQDSRCAQKMVQFQAHEERVF